MAPPLAVVLEYLGKTYGFLVPKFKIYPIKNFCSDSIDRGVQTMKQQQIFHVDLTKIDGDGDFPCPSCGKIMSPDDESGITYDIVDVKVKNDSLERLIIICSNCGSQIHLTGFENLNQYENL